MTNILAIDYRIEFAERLFCAMKRQGINQSELARKCGANRAWINRILNGKENLTLESIAKLSLAVNFDLFYNTPLRDIEFTMEAKRWTVTTNGRSKSLSF